jgi:hypothetical protein
LRHTPAGPPSVNGHRRCVARGAIESSADAQRVTCIAEVLTQMASMRVDLNAACDERTVTRWLPVLQDAGVELIANT